VPSAFKDSQHVCAVVSRAHTAQHDAEVGVSFVGHRKAVVATRSTPSGIANSD
jgi:hypothetical protein